MNDHVSLKGTSNGIILNLDNEIPFEELKECIARVIRESAKFLGSTTVALRIEGRRPDASEEREICGIIEENSELKIACIIDNDPALCAGFENAVKQSGKISGNAEAVFHKGNLRSGQALSCEQSIIVIGDINPGASITSAGSIIVLGSLRGTAFAGSTGYENAFVLALDMEPVQIRIADTIARSPDKPDRDDTKEPKIAFLENGSIYIEQLTKQILNDIKL